MKTFPKLLAFSALLLSSTAALATSDTYKLMVQLNQAGKDLEPFTTVISAGEEARYSETWTIDATKQILTDIKGKSTETTEPVKLGFEFRATPRALETGEIVVDYSFEDSRLLDMHTLPVGDALMKMPEIKLTSASSTVAVKEGEPFVVFPGSVTNDSIVTMTIVKQ